ncbi:hypothetical protein AVEN_155871-1 [Araneus ventricosus]|uniref:Uncharacterized protein n=1 Tax=Araneus ventricosus TaxID=182803 RepID=A0A4Y2S7N7_ARAVE|nr:hypothetical protein AVEN_155871-1 [Araneus ventricosus]
MHRSHQPKLHSEIIDIYADISSGVSSSDLAKRQPGTLNLARWLTTANRILRLYQLFIIPVVNFRATDYVGLIKWQACNVTPPTVLRQTSSYELLKMIQDDVPMDGRDFIKFPSHMQEVERIVKLVTEASRKRVGPQNRDGFIRATLKSRKQMSQFESKKITKNSAFVILYVLKVESIFYLIQVKCI